MLQSVTLIRLLIRLRIKSLMEYRGAFFIERVAQVISYSSAFASIWIIVDGFGAIGGWTWVDIAFLLSFQLLAYSCGGTVSYFFNQIEDLVRLGRFDVLLVKPISPWLYHAFSTFAVTYVGHVLLATVLLIWSITKVNIIWSASSVLYLVATLISSAMATAAFMTTIGATALIFVRARHLYSLYFSLCEVTRYPISIFPPALQTITLIILPIGFASFVPVAYLLGKPIPIFGDWGGIAAPFVGPALAGVAVWFWRFAISRYEGAGG